MKTLMIAMIAISSAFAVGPVDTGALAHGKRMAHQHGDTVSCDQPSGSITPSWFKGRLNYSDLETAIQKKLNRDDIRVVRAEISNLDLVNKFNPVSIAAWALSRAVNPKEIHYFGEFLIYGLSLNVGGHDVGCELVIALHSEAIWLQGCNGPLKKTNFSNSRISFDQVHY